jgi:hypothetical protein
MSRRRTMPVTPACAPLPGPACWRVVASMGSVTARVRALSPGVARGGTGTRGRPRDAGSSRSVCAPCRPGEGTQSGGGPKGGRGKTAGEPRVGIGHAQEERQEGPRCFLTAAQHWASTCLLAAGSARWPTEVLHAVAHQVCGMEAVQVRPEEAVTRHCRLSGGAPSLIPRAPAVAAHSAHAAFAQGHLTCGQKCRTISRDVGRAIRTLWPRYCTDGKTCDHVTGFFALQPDQRSRSDRGHGGAVPLGDGRCRAPRCGALDT